MSEVKDCCVEKKTFWIIGAVVKSDLPKQIEFKHALVEESCHVFEKRNQQTELQGIRPNYQHHHFHHILHLSKLPYQQRDLKAAQETTISAFWHTIKRCQTWFLLHCFGSGCQRIKHYLKEDSFSREKRPARFTDARRGLGSLGLCGQPRSTKENGNKIRKAVTGEGVGRTPTFLHSSLLGTWGLRRWSSSTQVSYSAGTSVQLGSGPKLPECVPQWGEVEAP